MKEETISDAFSVEAMQEALATYPRFAAFGARLVKVPLRGGPTFLVRYSVEPPRDDPDAWEFQNAVVKGYKRRAGI